MVGPGDAHDRGRGVHVLVPRVGVGGAAVRRLQRRPDVRRADGGAARRHVGAAGPTTARPSPRRWRHDGHEVRAHRATPQRGRPVAVPRLGRGVAAAVARRQAWPTSRSSSRGPPSWPPAHADRHRPHRCAVHDHRAPRRRPRQLEGGVPADDTRAGLRAAVVRGQGLALLRRGPHGPLPRWCTRSRWPATRSTRPSPSASPLGPTIGRLADQLWRDRERPRTDRLFWLDETAPHPVPRRHPRREQLGRADPGHAHRPARGAPLLRASGVSPARVPDQARPGRGERAAEADGARLPPARGPAR